jgi:heavy metal sensor kinase
LHVLVASADVEANAIEWEPNQRLLSFPGDTGESLTWVVLDSQGNRLDGSRPGDETQVLTDLARRPEPEQTSVEEMTSLGEPWRMARRHLQVTKFRPEEAAPGTQGERPSRKVSGLMIAVAVPLQPIRTQLQLLVVILVALSLFLWVTAALAGRQLCRQALRPLTRMAEAASAITADDLGRRLPESRTGDELADLGRAFNDLLGRLQESFERQKRFTGDASHQLRTPLTALLGQIEVALRRERPSEEYRRVLGAIHGQAIHLRQVVEMLLFLARADVETQLPDMERLDLAAWLPRHLESWSGHLRRGDFRSELVGDGPLWVRAHAPLLGQAIDNLLDNACKYSPPGSPITVRLGREDGEIRLEVADHGSGILPEDLGNIFGPFFRSQQARRQGIPGVGLGLAVTSRIVKAMGGRIDVASEPDQGSRFHITLEALNPVAK